MKYCEKYVPALSALVDGELNDTERAEVLAHLETCESCREFFAELTAMHAAFGELEEFDAPEGFADSVMARLHEAPKAKKRTPRAAWLSLAACAAVVLIAVGGPLREARFANDSAAPEAAMLMGAAVAPESEECAEEEYTDEFACVQNAPMTMTADSAAPENDVLTGAGDYKENIAEANGVAPEANGFEAPVENTMGETGEADADANDAYSNNANSNESNANDAPFANEAQLPRSVMFVYGAAREDYLLEEATGFDYYADGTVAGYDLPAEKLDEFLALLDADGVAYDSSVARRATTFYVQYEEAGANE